MSFTVDANMTADIMSLIMTFIIMLNVRPRENISSPDRRLYFYSAAACSIGIILDLIALALKDVYMENVWQWSFVTDTLYFIFTPAAAAMWLFFVDYKVYEDSSRIRKNAVLYSLPFLLNLALCIVNTFKPVYFSMSADNVYSREKYIFINFGIAYLYVIAATALVIQNRKKLPRRKFLPLVCFAIPPLICSILQWIFYGVSLMWAGEAFAVFVVFMSIQNDIANIDMLTGLNNRRSLEELLSAEFIKTESKTKLTGIMIDLDNFKSINDNFGHLVGDEALENMGELMSKSATKKDFVARYAGDEFVVIIVGNDENLAKDYIKTLEDNISVFNDTASKPYKLDFSYGFTTAKRNGNMSADKFLKIIDDKMYEHKKSKKICH